MISHYILIQPEKGLKIIGVCVDNGIQINDITKQLVTEGFKEVETIHGNKMFVNFNGKESDKVNVMATLLHKDGRDLGPIFGDAVYISNDITHIYADPQNLSLFR